MANFKLVEIQPPRGGYKVYRVIWANQRRDKRGDVCHVKQAKSRFAGLTAAQRAALIR